MPPSNLCRPWMRKTISPIETRSRTCPTLTVKLLESTINDLFHGLMLVKTRRSRSPDQKSPNNDFGQRRQRVDGENLNTRVYDTPHCVHPKRSGQVPAQTSMGELKIARAVLVRTERRLTSEKHSGISPLVNPENLKDFYASKRTRSVGSSCVAD